MTERAIDVCDRRHHSGTMSYPPAPKRAMSTSSKLALSVLAVVALCIGGSATISAFTDDNPKPAAATTTDASQAARFVLPTATYAPAVTPQPVATPAKKATRPAATRPATIRPRTTVPKPTTRRPATKRPTTRKPKPSPTTSAPRTGVHPGAFCSEHNELGRTVTGKLMRCETTAKDFRYRWRAV